MKRLTILLTVVALAGVSAGGDSPPRRSAGRALPAHERAILLEVGTEYGLNPVEVNLLLAIRRAENGGPGLEMGVGSNRPAHRARRHAHDPERSLRIQARWAAGTIKKRFTGDLEAFARLYCPPNWTRWAHLVRFWMKRESQRQVVRETEAVYRGLPDGETPRLVGDCGK